MSTDRFFSEIPVQATFLDAQRPDAQRPVPKDWHIVMAELADGAFRVSPKGYKNANVIITGSIVSILNLDRKLEIPFVFRGDSSILAIPNQLVPGAQNALMAVQNIARDEFGFEVKAIIVPVSELVGQGHIVTVSKYELSPDVVEAQFSGSGLVFCERLLRKNEGFAIRPESTTTQKSADFTGLQCRWDDIYGAKVRKICLVAKAIGNESTEDTYALLTDGIRRIYGDDEAARPVSTSDLLLSKSVGALASETSVAGPKSKVGKLLYTAKTKSAVELGRFLMASGIKAGSVQWAKYKASVVKNLDYRKVAGDFRQLLSGTAEQEEMLRAFLDDLQRQRRLAYGLHVSDRIQMTCIVLEYSGKHVHFVDGADGGFAAAAQEMKKQLSWNLTPEFGVYQ